MKNALIPIRNSRSFATAALALSLALFPSIRGVANEPCCIQVIDQSNGWPVPLIELTTTHHVSFVTDNAGVIAFDLPELMGVETWFSIRGHGYEVDKDGFGFSGIRLTPRASETLTVKVNRKLPAKRLGRITGGGIFAESQKLDRELDWQEQGLLGCDSVQNVVHQGKLFWGWGDTTLPGYPLGIFHMTGATTGLKPLAALEPPVRLRYEYFTAAKHRPRKIAEIAGEGPTWLSGYASVPDQHGQVRLVASYAKIKPPLDAYEHGLCVWNEQSENFERLKVIWNQTEPKADPRYPLGHTVTWQDGSGKDWLLFGDPFPALKCEATFESWSDPKSWIHWEPQKRVTAFGTQESIEPHRGAIAWNSFRKKWVTVFTQYGGKPSLLGEIWYAEAEEPTGPWVNALKIVTHDDYTFYNPQLHAEFTGDGSPVLLFEATYTKEFSGEKRPTPRYDYNQILYRLDLDELPAGY